MATLEQRNFAFENVDFHLWSPTDLAWAAGFIDGDGMISLFRRIDSKRRHNEFYIKVAAMNCNPEPLDKLQLMFGGSVCAVTHKSRHSKWSDSWAWAVTHKRAEKVLEVLTGYLVAKHEQAVLAMVARELVGTTNWRKRPEETIRQLQTIEAQFRLLNRKGD